MKRACSAVVLLCVLFALSLSHGVSAQSDSITCGSFAGDRAAAQAYFDANGQPTALDADGDGQACASAEDGDFSSNPSATSNEPSAGPEDITCGDFAGDQAAAQAYFEANGNPYNLDLDKDGQACASPEDGDYTSKPSAGPESGSSSTASSNSASEGEAAGSASDSTVASFPVTGAGDDLMSSSGSIFAALLAVSLVLGASARFGQRSSAR